VLERYTVFEKEMFLKFLTKYLSLKEGEVYVLMDNVVEDDFAMAVATKTYPLNVFSVQYNIVTSVHNKFALESQGSHGSCGGTTDNITDYLLGCADGKFVCLKNCSVYSLLAGTKLRKCFSKYPYMRDLAFELVDLKLQNPFISDDERLNKVLGDLQKKKRLPITPSE
ncbi:MAG: hypothetical protein K2L98_02430, partial [Bacilli bacterium]|nr:hypothetical protein [Bacilli bacterium]